MRELIHSKTLAVSLLIVVALSLSVWAVVTINGIERPSLAQLTNSMDNMDTHLDAITENVEVKFDAIDGKIDALNSSLNDLATSQGTILDAIGE